MVDASMLQSEDVARLAALVQSTHQANDANAPDATNFENHSGGIIDVLEDLLEKARAQLKDGRQKETTSLHNFHMLEQSLTDAIKFNNKDLKEAKESLVATQGAKAASESELGVTKKQQATDTDALASIKQECATKANSYVAEKTSRDEELKAIAEAKKIISEMTTGAGSLSYNLGQVSFAQCARMGLGMHTELAHYEVVRYIREVATKRHSEALTQLASRIASTLRQGAVDGQDPFGKVKGLITDLIARLEKEAAEAASHKAYCDEEIAETNEKKEKAEMWHERFTNKINRMSAKSSTLKQQVAELQKSLAELAQTQVEMDKIRAQEHKQLLSNKADMELGIEGVRRALKVLREYYNADGKSHAAATGGASGVIGMLEVIQADFAKGFGEMMSAEVTSQDDYEKASKENEVDKAEKEQDVKYKTKTITELAASFSEETSNRDGVSAELDAILEYKAKLTEMCQPKAEVYCDRKAKRDAEIAGLKEAISILENEAAFAQRSMM
eukprot:NODE_4473_length_1887_cov_3.692045.p1 GENE.NODE_4473_length_1887_cov_3.692045~~NODE_4473_length_1887_cov_3.692045.p1  ORF type:complete len:543 (+),score=179.80 NODE_4473_length_1887_cov_3.692045:123-1631(+)